MAPRSRMTFIPALLAVGLTFGAAVAAPADPVATFTIKEHFGVSHPEQIVEFDLEARVDAKNAYLLGPDGRDDRTSVLS